MQHRMEASRGPSRRTIPFGRLRELSHCRLIFSSYRSSPIIRTMYVYLRAWERRSVTFPCQVKVSENPVASVILLNSNVRSKKTKNPSESQNQDQMY